MINVSSDIATVIMTDTANVIQQLWVIFAVFIGVIIAFYIIRKIIFLLTLIKR
jgi:flagellar biosynthesis/type III secretory pathway M-ring protein FliF/YscJ